MRRVIIALLVLLALPTTGNALTLQRPSGSPYPTATGLGGDVAAMRVQAPTGTVTVHREHCPSLPFLAACVLVDHPDTMYLPYDMTASLWERRLVLYHELGHVVDITAMRPDVREQFSNLMRREGQVWGEQPREGVLSPQEMFADLYANCAMYGTRPPWKGERGELAYSEGSVMRTRAYRSACRMLKYDQLA